MIMERSLQSDLMAHYYLGKIQGTLNCMEWGVITKDQAADQVAEVIREWEEKKGGSGFGGLE